MKTRFYYLACLLFLQLAAVAQVKIGDNSTTINNASLLELETTNKGFVLPRVSIADVSAASPLPVGLLTGTVVYNTNTGTTGGSGIGIYLWNGTRWLFISAGTSLSGSAWLLAGNSGLSASANFIGTTDLVSMRFRTNNVQRVIIDSLGRVGIGLNNPSYALSILAASNPLYLSGVQATATFSTDSVLTINAGVVKKTPYSSINGAYWGLSGNSGTSAATNFIGTSDNQSLVFKTNNQLSGKIDLPLNSVSLGYQSANSITTGTNNVFLGYQSGFGTITSSNNTGVGAQALRSNTASANTAIGSSSLRLNTTGGNNTAAGSFSLQVNTTGSNNTATGYAALGANVQGAGNTAHGNATLQGNVQGNNNTAIGNGAMQFNDQGNANTAIGAFTLQNSNLGSANTALGYSALGGNTTGTNNTGTGNMAGITNTAGTLNTFIGNQADATIANLTNATAIGANAQVSSSNSLVLGGAAVNVGIGTSSPSYKLHILAASDPLYLGGVQATAAFTTDSLLTIFNGVVKKAPYSSLTGSFWSVTGNSGTNYAANFIGTTDNSGFRVRTNNSQRMLIDSLGDVAIGTTVFDPVDPERLIVDNSATTSRHIATFKGRLNDFLQVNVQNMSSGTNASSDIVATSDDGTDSTNYIDMGINSSTYAPGVENFGGPHDGYLYTYARHLLLGAAASGSDIIFLVGGGQLNSNSALRISGITRNIIVGRGENGSAPIGNTVRGPNAASAGTNLTGGSITLAGGSSTGTATGGGVNINGGNSVSGTAGTVGINTANNGATNINAGTNTGTLTLGSTGNNVLLPKFTTVGGLYYTSVNTGQVSTTGSNMAWDSINNRLGIGISNPSYKLSVLSASNPLYLSGVQATGTFTTDSVLTINAGVVKKAAYSSLTGSFWALTGNGGTTAGTNFIGTTDAVDFVTKTNNIERLRITGTGNFGIANASPTEKLDVTGNVRFSGALMPNNLAGTSGYILQSAGTGTAPVWADPNTVAWALNGNNVSAIKNLGTTSNFDLPFITNNTEGMRLTTVGYLGVGITGPEDMLHLVDYTPLSATPYNMVTVETRNTTASQGSQPPQLNHVRQIPTAAYTTNTQYLGAIENFAFRVPAASTFNNFAQWQGSTLNTNAIIGFATRTGMTNGNPATGTMTGGITTATGYTYNMVLNGTTLGVANLLGGATTLSTDANGNIIRTPSDIKLKTNIITIDSALDKVMLLRGVTYNWKDTSRFGPQKEIGFIAQEIEKVVPEVVKSGGEYKSVNYQVITALLAAAMQQQQKQLEDQNLKIQGLQKTMNDQQKAIDRLKQEVKALKPKPR